MISGTKRAENWCRCKGLGENSREGGRTRKEVNGRGEKADFIKFVSSSGGGEEGKGNFMVGDSR